MSLSNAPIIGMALIMKINEAVFKIDIRSGLIDIANALLNHFPKSKPFSN
ncbi:hypothetical protein JNUCC74_18795 [Cerasibacillus sp. JNUCC 74]